MVFLYGVPGAIRFKTLAVIMVCGCMIIAEIHIHSLSLIVQSSWNGIPFSLTSHRYTLGKKYGFCGDLLSTRHRSFTGKDHGGFLTRL